VQGINGVLLPENLTSLIPTALLASDPDTRCATLGALARVRVPEPEGWTPIRAAGGRSLRVSGTHLDNGINGFEQNAMIS